MKALKREILVILILLSASLVPLGCESRVENASDEARQFDQGRDPGVPNGAGIGSAEGWAALPDLRIDGWEDTLEVFQWVGVSPDGWVALPQGGANAIRFFDTEGRRLGRLGRDGEGPGEFRSVQSAQTLYGSRQGAGWIGDTLWIWDSRLSRITLVSPDRRPSTIITPNRIVQEIHGDFAISLSPPLLSPRAVYSDGSILWLGQGHDRGGEYRTGFFRVSVDGSECRLVALLFPDQAHAEGTIYVPESPNPLDDVSPDGEFLGLAVPFVEGDNAGTFLVTVLSAEGDTVFSRVYPFEAERIPSARAGELREYVQRRTGESQARGSRGLGVAHATVPEIFPPITKLIMGTDGSVWLRLHADVDSGQRSWLVLDRQGDPLDTLSLPRTGELKVATLETLWVAETDAYDVPSLVRYRLKRPQ